MQIISSSLWVKRDFLPLQKLPFFCSPWEAVKIIFVVFWKEKIPDKAKLVWLKESLSQIGKE